MAIVHLSFMQMPTCFPATDLCTEVAMVACSGDGWGTCNMYNMKYTFDRRQLGLLL